MSNSHQFSIISNNNNKKFIILIKVKESFHHLNQLNNHWKQNLHHHLFMYKNLLLLETNPNNKIRFIVQIKQKLLKLLSTSHQVKAIYLINHHLRILQVLIQRKIYHPHLLENNNIIINNNMNKIQIAEPTYKNNQ